MTHTDFEQLAAGYVLGALEPADENAFERHLEGCESCEATVRELEAVVGKLAYLATPVEPPPALRASIRREVAATARPRGARTTRPAGGAEVLVVGSPDVAAVAAALVSSLRPYGLPNSDISVSIVEQIPRHATTGKLKRFIALSPSKGEV